MVDVDTPDGTADAFFVTPKKGKHPGVVMWPDIAGLREAYMTMAARLASEGYAVLAVNHYYRSSRFPILGTFAEWRTEAGKAKITPLKEAISLDGIARDGAAFVAWLDRQPEVDPDKKIACAGYCMTGSYTFRTAAAVPERVGVIASFHGSGLVTEEPTSPHLLLFKTKKLCALVCIAQNDDEREPATKGILRRAAEGARLPAEIS
jgi:carboxymethylenebutenolidase